MKLCLAVFYPESSSLLHCFSCQMLGRPWENSSWDFTVMIHWCFSPDSYGSLIMSCAVQMREFAHFQRVNVMTVILKLDVKISYPWQCVWAFFCPVMCWRQSGYYCVCILPTWMGGTWVNILFSFWTDYWRCWWYRWTQKFHFSHSADRVLWLECEVFCSASHEGNYLLSLCMLSESWHCSSWKVVVSWV